MNIIVIPVTRSSRSVSQCMMLLSILVLSARAAYGESFQEEAVLWLREPLPDHHLGPLAGRPKHAAEAAPPVRLHPADRNDGR